MILMAQDSISTNRQQNRNFVLLDLNVTPLQPLSIDSVGGKKKTSLFASLIAHKSFTLEKYH